eukprot:TRINITY_DN18503_c0_g1_i4.p1 TRINITY_DN18503_c0_g1~~TRINITY_DN18503_c0_g1_i4.p1  ORF type:complete len:376 (+),score=74.00 TRINITY_DN18503_c0_g1_i4:169-1296(+)
MCIRDSFLHFCQRWNHHLLEHHQSIEAFGILAADEVQPKAVATQNGLNHRDWTRTEDRGTEEQLEWAPSPSPSPSSSPSSSSSPSPSDPGSTCEDCPIRLSRGWTRLFNGYSMLEEFCKVIRGCKSLLYIEHQYIQDPTIVQAICDALTEHPQLRVLIMTCIHTDLPRGLVGSLIGENDAVIHSQMCKIHGIAPDRVGIFGLCWVDPDSQRVKTIYIHSKLLIADNSCLVIGSTNLDSFSFFHSSEVTAFIESEQSCKQTRERLFREHLGPYYTEGMAGDDQLAFDTFKRVSDQVFGQLQATRTLQWRLVPLVPTEKYTVVRGIAEYPSILTKTMSTTGLTTPTWAQVAESVKRGYVLATGAGMSWFRHKLKALL